MPNHMRSIRDIDPAGGLPLDNAFWRFSLAVYTTEGVEAECLALQESRSIDVNLLLYCVWLGARGVSLREDEFAAAVRLVEDWHRAVVRTLRGVRRHIKTYGVSTFEPFRSAVKKLELEAEQIEQALLFRAAPTMQKPTKPAEAIAANLRRGVGYNAAAPRLTAAALVQARGTQ